MKFKSPVYSQVSGSIAGLTYANNAGGLYARARSIPVDPSSAAQQAVRATFAALAQAWRDTLTAAQRIDWNTWASQNPITNSFGDPLVLSGQQMYVRLNACRLRTSFATRVDAAPTTAGLASLTPGTLSASVGANDIELTYTNTDAWANEAEGGLMLRCSPAQSAGRTFFRGPYRLCAAVQGDGSTAPTSPLIGAPPFGEGPTAGQVFFAVAIAFRADGRLSNAQRLGPVVAA